MINNLNTITHSNQLIINDIFSNYYTSSFNSSSNYTNSIYNELEDPVESISDALTHESDDNEDNHERDENEDNIARIQVLPNQELPNIIHKDLHI